VSSPLIKSYGPTKAKTFLKCKNERKIVYYGVELEIDSIFIKTDKLKNKCAVSILDINKKVEIKTDPSVPNGFEIATQPASLQYHLTRQKWEDILKCLKTAGFEEDIDTAGIHVHVDKTLFSKNDLQKISYFIHSQKKRCEIIAKRKENCYGRYKKVSFKDKETLVDENYSSSEAINFTDSYKRNTFEIRIFRSTFTVALLYSIIEFIDALCHFIKKTTKETIKNRNICWDKFCKYIVHKMKKKKYFYLTSYLFSLGLLSSKNFVE
jgi:hypothetical protein